MVTIQFLNNGICAYRVNRSLGKLGEQKSHLRENFQKLKN